MDAPLITDAGGNEIAGRVAAAWLSWLLIVSYSYQ